MLCKQRNAEFAQHDFIFARGYRNQTQLRYLPLHVSKGLQKGIESRLAILILTEITCESLGANVRGFCVAWIVTKLIGDTCGKFGSRQKSFPLLL